MSLFWCFVGFPGFPGMQAHKKQSDGVKKDAECSFFKMDNDSLLVPPAAPLWKCQLCHGAFVALSLDLLLPCCLALTLESHAAHGFDSAKGISQSCLFNWGPQKGKSNPRELFQGHLFRQLAQRLQAFLTERSLMHRDVKHLSIQSSLDHAIATMSTKKTKVGLDVATACDAHTMWSRHHGCLLDRHCVSLLPACDKALTQSNLPPEICFGVF